MNDSDQQERNRRYWNGQITIEQWKKETLESAPGYQPPAPPAAGPAPEADEGEEGEEESVFEEWTCTFPGKFGLSWKRAWDGVGSKEEAEAHAAKNCNVVAVPLELFEDMKRYELRMIAAEEKLAARKPATPPQADPRAAAIEAAARELAEAIEGTMVAHSPLYWRLVRALDAPAPPAAGPAPEGAGNPWVELREAARGAKWARPKDVKEWEQLQAALDAVDGLPAPAGQPQADPRAAAIGRAARRVSAKFEYLLRDRSARVEDMEHEIGELDAALDAPAPPAPAAGEGEPADIQAFALYLAAKSAVDYLERSGLLGLGDTPMRALANEVARLRDNDPGLPSLVPLTRALLAEAVAAMRRRVNGRRDPAAVTMSDKELLAAADALAALLGSAAGEGEGEATR